MLRSCGLHEAVRDTVLADTSPAARWNLVPCDGSTWFSLRPASDESEVMLLCTDQESAEIHHILFPAKSPLVFSDVLHATTICNTAVSFQVGTLVNASAV